MEQGHHAAGVVPGQILLGKYRIERVLGVGGMGVVVAATHVQLEERVAIKFLLPEALGHGEAVARFVREARAAVKIKSEHVARVSDVGTLENGAPYIIMEYLEGSDLAGLVQARGPLPIEEAIEALLQACEAIAEAHSLGIVHRDLKPANLFVIRRADGTPSVKVLDFGISKLTGPPGSGSDMSMTKTSAIMGSPLYMSPEQMASSRDVDARTDIWALGVILFEILTGRIPFEADSMPQLCAMILQSPTPPLRRFRPDAPEGLERVIFHCLEKNRAQRYATIADLAAALLPFASRRAKNSIERISRVIQGANYSGELLAEASPPSQAVPAASVGGTNTNWSQTTQKRGKGAVFLVGGLLFALTAGAAIAAVTVLRHREPSSDGESSAAAGGHALTAALPAAGPASAQPSASALVAPIPSAVESAVPAVVASAVAATPVAHAAALKTVS
ncbi:MAG TPA: serine/threonine-protein kinase, partial [Polyangiaceae bacterium]|nr:serine/threonine-protein kinase [Polyangiaceae bacterium]